MVEINTLTLLFVPTLSIRHGATLPVQPKPPSSPYELFMRSNTHKRKLVLCQCKKKSLEYWGRIKQMSKFHLSNDLWLLGWIYEVNILYSRIYRKYSFYDMSKVNLFSAGLFECRCLQFSVDYKLVGIILVRVL